MSESANLGKKGEIGTGREIRASFEREGGASWGLREATREVGAYIVWSRRANFFCGVGTPKRDVT
jgi:hypothetical protein